MIQPSDAFASLLRSLQMDDVDDLQLGLRPCRREEWLRKHFFGEGWFPLRTEGALPACDCTLCPSDARARRLVSRLTARSAGLDYRLGAWNDGAMRWMRATSSSLSEGLGRVVVGADAEGPLTSCRRGPEDRDGGPIFDTPKLLEHVVAGHISKLRSRRGIVVIVKLAEINAPFFPEECVGIDVETCRIYASARWTARRRCLSRKRAVSPSSRRCSGKIGRLAQSKRL